MRILTLFLLLFGLFQELKAQCNPEEGGATCAVAPVVCLSNLCDATENNPPDGAYTGWCGPNTAIHNPQYFAFIPTSPDVSFTVLVGTCTGGQNSIQAAILSACPWSGSGEVIDCANNIPSGQTFTLTATGLTVGNTYYLVFDGSAGAQCEYTIQQANGVFEPQLMGDLSDVEAIPDEPVCQGYNNLTLTASPEVEGAHGYWWFVEWENDTIETTDPTLPLVIPASLDPGTYEICVQAFSGCDIGEELPCIEIEVYEIPEEEKEPEIYCPEEFPFLWGSVNITGPGDYTQTYTTPEGCTFDSLWTVEEYPEVPLGEVDTLHCEEYLVYEGEQIDAAGTYEFFYPGQGLNGCDSMMEMNVTLAFIDAFVELTCENGEFVLTPYIQDLIPGNANVEWEWYESGTLIFDNAPLLTLTGGCFDLYAVVETPAGECTFFVETFCFDQNQYWPDPPNLGFTDTMICAQPGVFFTVIVDPDEDPQPYEWVWSAPANVPLFQDGSNTAEFDFSNAGPSEICVYAINECGIGPETCFNVDILLPPVPDFSYELEVCADSTTVITFTGTASPNAVFTWDFDGPTTVSGSGSGPYTVTWSVPGDKIVSLTIDEPGCASASTSEAIEVTNFLPPVINCTSTISSVEFNWGAVNGASGYIVSIDGGPGIPIDSTDFFVGNLTPGTDVVLTLTVISAGACDDIILTDTCTAEDCPAPTVILSGQDSACLNDPTIIDLDAQVNGSPGTGTWSGNGIVDPVQGLFDPVLAGSGQHQLTYTTNINGCDFNTPFIITVFDSLTADFVLDPVICITDDANLTYTGNASNGASYNWTFAPANVVSGSGSGPYVLDWATAGNKTVRLQVSENGCMSDVISQTIDVIATLNAPVINCSPNTSGMIFDWVVDPLAAAHVVNILTGQTGNLVGNTLEFTGLNPGDQVDLEIVTISAGPCPDRRDTATCIAQDCPPVMIVLTPVPDICLYPGTSAFTLEVQVTGGSGSGTWSGTGITNPATGAFDPNIAGAGSHQITYTYLDQGCTFNESITINVFDPPGAFISNNSPILTCASPTLTLDGSSSSGGSLTYQWTTSDGAFGPGPTTNATVVVAGPGTYQLLVTGAASGCKDSVSISVAQDAGIPTCDAGPDRTLTCDVTSFVIGGASTTGPNIVYTWTTPDGNIMGSTSGITAIADAPGTYTIMVEDTVTSCQCSGQVVIDIDTAVADITLTPGVTIDCNTPVTTATSSLSEPILDYDFSWSTTDGTIVGNTTGQNIDVSQGGIYTLTIENKRNGCTRSADVIIDESDEIIDAVDVSLMNIVCHGDNNGALTVNGVAGGTPPYTYAWSANPTGNDNLTDLGPGQYTLTVSDQNGCSFVETFTITQPDLVTLDLGNHRTVSAEDSVHITLTTNLTPEATGSIHWDPYNGTLCPGCTTFSFIAINSDTISATIIDTAGCVATDFIRLTVIVPRIFYIPNTFSPNDDGNNDYFTVYGRSNLINLGWFRIFDRWGNQLFEKLDVQPGVDQLGWNGRFRDEPVQPGVYVYSIQLQYEDGRDEVVTGDITVIR